MERGKFKVSTFKIVSFLLYIITIFTVDEGYFPKYNYLKYFCIVVIAVYLLANYRFFMTRRNRTLNRAIIVFCLFSIAASYLRRDEIIIRDPFLSAIVFMATLAETFFFLEVAAEKERIGEIITQFYRFTLFCAIVVDIAAIFIPGLKSSYGNYLCGTKFSVSYLHIILIALYMSKEWLNQDRKDKRYIALIIMSVWAIWISRYVNCNTGMIGAVLLFVAFMISEKIKTWLCSLKTMIIFTLVPALFYFFYEFILLNSTVQNIVVGTLGRELTLTGRTIIYDKLPSVFASHFWTGYGYGTTYEVTKRYIGFADTQNCWTEWMMMVGIVGVVLLAFVLIIVFKKINTMKPHRGFPIVAIICIFFIMGCVEITMGISFFCLVSILYGIETEKG